MPIRSEAAHAWGLSKAGVIREHYLRIDRPGAALVLEVPGVAGAHAVLNDFPLVRGGLIEFECLSLATFLGVDALFEGSLDAPPHRLADPTKVRSSRPTHPSPRPTTGETIQ